MQSTMRSRTPKAQPHGRSLLDFGAILNIARPPQPESPLSGVTVLLVTDLQAFTTMVEKLGDVEARLVIRHHNRLLRECISRQRGTEVAHTGDGMIAAFRSVASALHCAQDVQRELSAGFGAYPSGQLRARIGIHAGEPLPEEGRLFGSCVNATVRVCELAEAGHVLVTDVVQQLARGRGFDFQSRGTVKLRGFQTEMSVFELLPQGCGAELD
jgi:class 3 adenylate cyclase